MTFMPKSAAGSVFEKLVSSTERLQAKVEQELEIFKPEIRELSARFSDIYYRIIGEPFPDVKADFSTTTPFLDIEINYVQAPAGADHPQSGILTLTIPASSTIKHGPSYKLPDCSISTQCNQNFLTRQFNISESEIPRILRHEVGKDELELCLLD